MTVATDATAGAAQVAFVPTDARPLDLPTTMRAARLVAPGVVRFAEAPVPRPGAHEVLVRLEGCGVCASSVPLWEGRPWFTYPQDPGCPGHEGWGLVADIGEGVTSVSRGDRVATVSYRAFAEYDVADESAVVRLPRELDGRPFPGEAFGCGFNVWSRAGIGPGQTVAIVGIGFLGAMLVRLAKTAGARVIAVSRREASRQLARRLGADLAFSLDDEATASAIAAATHGAGCERVVEAAGVQQSLDLASSLVATRGRLVVAGYHQDGRRVVDMQSWNWRGIDVVNAHERDTSIYARGIAEAAAAIASGALDASLLVSHEFPLERLGDALEHTRTRPPGFVKAVVRMDRDPERPA